MKILVRPHLGTPINAHPYEGVYAQHVTSGELPNRPISVEMSAVTEYTLDDPQHFVREVKKIRERLGDKLIGIDLDEPITKVRLRAGSDMAVEDIITRYVAPVVRAAKGVPVRWIEAWPALGWDTVRVGLQQARILNLPVERFVVDLDWNRVHDEAPRYRWWQKLLGDDPRPAYRERFGDELRRMRWWTTKAGMELGLIVGSPVLRDYADATDNGFFESACGQIEAMQWSAGWPWADVVYVQSWEDWGPSVDALERVVTLVEGAGG